MSERSLLGFVQLDVHRRTAWIDPAHVIAIVQGNLDETSLLHLTSGRTLHVEGDVNDVADRILGIASELEDEPVGGRPVDPAAAREWARENGISVKPVGLLPKAVLEGYRQHLASDE